MMRPLILFGTAALLAGCDSFDPDLRGRFKGAFNTADAVQVAAAPRPKADARGIISYPNYQVVVAKRGDTVASVAQRIGSPIDELARFNGVPVDATLREGEILALPRPVQTAAALSPAAPAAITPAGAPSVSVQSIATAAIDRAETQPQPTPVAAPAPAPETEEPIRHKVERGETAYSISRLYGISVRSLADWNSLPSDYTIREGQFLLIPVLKDGTARRRLAQETTLPGTGTATPTPPSAAKPLPNETTEPTREANAAGNPAGLPSPELGKHRTQASSKMAQPADGKIIRDFQKGKSDGIDIAAAAGSPVRAAADGKVAAITTDTDQVPIVVIRHDDGLLTVYAHLDDLSVKKGDTVTRGQKIAEVRGGDTSFVHFEVRKGLEAVDPDPFLNG
ncbi:MAG: peptidoglycan DD-metalloendopeptidase family protein [Pseudomonadota bacterium]